MTTRTIEEKSVLLLDDGYWLYDYPNRRLTRVRRQFQGKEIDLGYIDCKDFWVYVLYKNRIVWTRTYSSGFEESLRYLLNRSEEENQRDYDSIDRNRNAADREEMEDLRKRRPWLFSKGW